MISERRDVLEGLIQKGHTSLAIEMVRGAQDYNEGEAFVFAVLKEEKSTPELVEAALETFLGTRKNRYPQHGYWVHSLSHFTGVLWKRRMDGGWIKKFNEAAFKGANELGDHNCSDRLVGDFIEYAEFNDDPVAFGLTVENLRWMNWERAAYYKVRIEAGPFESEEAFVRWKLRQPEVRNATVWDNDAQTRLSNIKEIRDLIQRLQELGADASEFNGLEKDLLTKQLSKLEAELPAATQDWQRERLEKAIQKTRAALA